MSLTIPPVLLALDSPFNGYPFSLSLPGVWSEEVGDIAVASLESLVGLYCSGFSAQWYTPADDEMRMFRTKVAVQRLKPTYDDLANLEAKLLSRFDPEWGITLDDVRSYLDKHIPTCALMTFTAACQYLSKHANSRVDWPGAQHLLSLAETHWRDLPEPVSGELVMCAAQVNRKRAFPVLKAFVDDPKISLKARNTATLVGGMIENPLDPAIFDMPKDP